MAAPVAAAAAAAAAAPALIASAALAAEEFWTAATGETVETRRAKRKATDEAYEAALNKFWTATTGETLEARRAKRKAADEAREESLNKTAAPLVRELRGDEPFVVVSLQSDDAGSAYTYGVRLSVFDGVRLPNLRLLLSSQDQDHGELFGQLELHGQRIFETVVTGVSEASGLGVLDVTRVQHVCAYVRLCSF